MPFRSTKKPFNWIGITYQRTQVWQACTPEIQTQEQSYLSALQSASQYTIDGNTLTLTTASGPLVFDAAVAIQPVTTQ